MKYRLAIMLLGLVFGFSSVKVSATDDSAGNRSEARPAAHGVPVGAQSIVSAVVGRDELDYKITAHAGYATAENARNHLTAAFRTDGVHIRA